jgi:GH24 family phage-related lysozyme (muramidase)
MVDGVQETSAKFGTMTKAIEELERTARSAKSVVGDVSGLLTSGSMSEAITHTSDAVRDAAGVWLHYRESVWAAKAAVTELIKSNLEAYAVDKSYGNLATVTPVANKDTLSSLFASFRAPDLTHISPEIDNLAKSFDRLIISDPRSKLNEISTTLDVMSHINTSKVNQEISILINSLSMLRQSSDWLASGHVFADLGNMLVATDQFLDYQNRAMAVSASGVSENLANAITEAGNYASVMEVIKGIKGSGVNAGNSGIGGFITDITNGSADTLKGGLDIIITQLKEIPGLSDQAASEIASSFVTVDGTTGQLVSNLTNIAVRLGRNQEEALAFAKSYTDSIAAGKSQSQAADEIAQQVSNRYDAVTRKLNEQKESYKELGVLGQILAHSLDGELKTAEEVKSQLDSQVASLKEAATAADTYKASMANVKDEADQLLTKLRSMSDIDRLGDIAGQLDKIYKAYGNLGGGDTPSTGDAATLIKHFEGFSSKAYKDSDGAYRVGYGSDTYQTDPDDPNSKKNVGPATQVTQEQADADLERRIPEFQAGIIHQLSAEDLQGNKADGQKMWDDLPEKIQASLTSIAYNFGHVPDSILDAVARSGAGQPDRDSIDASVISAAIRGYKTDSPRLKERMYQTAQNIDSDDYDAEKHTPAGNLRGGGESVMTPAIEEITKKLIDRSNEIQQKLNGGTPSQKAAADALDRSASGQGDTLKDKTEAVAAAQQEYEAAQSQEVKRQKLADLQRAQVALAQAEVEYNKALIPISDTKLEKAKAIYDIEMKAAGDDVVKKRAAQDTYDAAVREDRSERNKITADQLDSSYQATLADYQRKRDLAEEDKKSHVLNASQKLAADLALEQSRYQAELDYHTKLAALYKTNDPSDTTSALEYQKQQDKITQITAAEGKKREDIIKADNAAIQAEYDQVFNKIGGTVTSGIMGMIQGTENFRKVLQQVALDIVQMFVKAGVDMVMHWIEHQAMMTVATITAQTQQTAATATGSAARTAVVVGSAATGVAAEKSMNAAAVSSDAGKAAAGAYSAVAGIPLIGPFLAPGAAAAAFAATMAFGSFDTGSWYVPQSGLAFIHEGETIIPSRGGLAEEFRNAVTGGGASSSPHVQMNVSAVDTEGVRQFFSNNSRHLTTALNDAMRRGDHLGLSRLGGS